jgi:hypothetical protein
MIVKDVGERVFIMGKIVSLNVTDINGNIQVLYSIKVGLSDSEDHYCNSRILNLKDSDFFTFDEIRKGGTDE